MVCLKEGFRCFGGLCLSITNFLFTLACRFKPMPQSFVGVVTNTFVHIFMYAYFSLTSHIKSLRKYGHLIT